MNRADKIGNVVNIKIHDLAVEDRPREKLLEKGCKVLTNAELLAIVIGSGNSNTSAVNLAQIVLKNYNNDLDVLAKCTIKDLQKFSGIGLAKAITIISALELCRRRESQIKNAVPILRNSESIYNLIKSDLVDKIVEEFWIILVNNSNRFIKKQLISSGGISSTLVDPRVIFKIALEYNATAIILIHNHPSGNLNPSLKDIEITKKVIEGAKTLDLVVLDHIIVAGNSYFSFVDDKLVFSSSDFQSE